MLNFVRAARCGVLASVVVVANSVEDCFHFNGIITEEVAVSSDEVSVPASLLFLSKKDIILLVDVVELLNSS